MGDVPADKLATCRTTSRSDSRLGKGVFHILKR